MLISVTFSKPSAEVENLLGKPYRKIRIKTNSSSTGQSFFAEFFTETQAFHKTFSETELNDFIEQHAGTTFKNCVQRFDDKEITILANNKGKISTIERKISLDQNSSSRNSLNKKNSKSDSTQTSKYFSKPENGTSNHNRIKNYIIAEGTPVLFLISLGIMTPEGKVINSRYDKFKQINRFLEYINDILPSVMEQKKSESHPLKIADFGCGKSYLTFAVHYFLTQIKKIDCRIVGLDLKKDVIEHCNKLAKDFGCEGLIFKIGDIAEYSDSEPENNPDIIITLHACDTATDYALKYAVEKNAKAILSVPCCQHEINQQLEKNKKLLSESEANVLAPVFKHGLLRERVSALLTDSLRADYLERCGYKVDVMEFIDMSHTPKNILLRAVRKQNVKNISEGKNPLDKENTSEGKPDLIDFLKISPSIYQ
ncbi:SAM-dependent methyltransferase [Treponema sp.]|uniref:class I SAM-dependent methyltransferase n=1 Tax=Treponema sp. TaxID=166 RepID=UPI00298D8E64|nr:SAM-dependent methyltransferase [Treponema sp.]